MKYHTFITYGINEEGEPLLSDNDIVWHKYSQGNKALYNHIRLRCEEGNIPQLEYGPSVVFKQKHIPKLNAKRTEFLVFTS